MKKILTNKSSILYWLNKYFINRIGGIIVEGEFQANFYSNITSPDKIHIIPNFAQDYLFSNTSDINNKFDNASKIKLLFLSNLIYGKGHWEIVEAFSKISTIQQSKFSIKFAGGFENDFEKSKFLSEVKKFPEMEYVGYVNGSEKAVLFKESHVFCLPTYYPYEGQPFVIIESYASGCCVVTTNHSGIGFIFKNSFNGLEVEKQSVDDLVRIFNYLPSNLQEIKKYGLNNYSLAKLEYNEKVYLSNINSVFSKFLNK